MIDLISRQAVLKELPHALWGKEWDEVLAKAIIESMPTIEPKHGKWKQEWNDLNCRFVYECSACGQPRSGVSEWNYCPTCGARMDL